MEVTTPEAALKAVNDIKANLGEVLKLEDRIKALEAAGEGASEIKTQIAKINADTAEKVDAAKVAIEKAQTDRLDEIEVELTKRLGLGGAGGSKSAGTRFVESDEFKTAPDRTRTAPVMVDRKSLHTKDVTTSANQNPPNYTGEVIEPQKPNLAMRNLLPVGRSARDVIKYVRMTQRAENAAIVAPGALKPESPLAFSDETAQMVKIAHFIPVTEEQLSDIDGLRSTVDAELRYGIEKAEDDYILNDGTAGLIANATAYAAATYGNTVSSPTLLDHIRGMIAQLQVADFAPDGIVLNPIDWFKIETTKTSEGAYIFANPQGVASPRMWGLPVVSTNQIASADVLLGAFQIAAMLYDGQLQGVYGIQLRTGQPNDYFLKNLYAVLAEERIALEVKRTGAMVYYDSDAA